MVGYYKWIGVGLGLFLSRGHFYGAILGFIFGAFIDNIQRAAQYLNEKNQGQNYRQRGSASQEQNSYDFFQQFYQQGPSYTLKSSLLVLSAAVMKADNKVLKSELGFVKAFLKQQFGADFDSQDLKELKNYIDDDFLPVAEICHEFRIRTRPEVRIQVMQYLQGIAQADGVVSSAEQRILTDISTRLGIVSQQNNYHQQFGQQRTVQDTKKDYRTLGIAPGADLAAVKKAYRKLAIQYHPDKVAQLSASEQESAKQKFQEIQSAYERIKKEKGG
jgi:DnaJ like chaperone protein